MADGPEPGPPPLAGASAAGHHRSQPMAIIQFPDPRTASPEGIVAIGGDLHPESVIAAYRQGIFP